MGIGFDCGERGRPMSLS